MNAATTIKRSAPVVTAQTKHSVPVLRRALTIASASDGLMKYAPAEIMQAQAYFDNGNYAACAKLLYTVYGAKA